METVNASALFDQLRARLHVRTPRTFTLPGVDLRESAVLAPVFLRSGEPHLLFTRRPAGLRNHGGQISFPGGAKDPDDPTPLHTALRETYEELGIPTDAVRVLGMLDELPTITRFRIAPFVGVIPAEFAYVPSPHEIEEIIEVPLRALLDPSIHRVERWGVGDEEHDVDFYEYGRHTIWGATGRIVKNLLSIIGELPAALPLIRP